MPTALARLSGVLQLARVTTAFAAVGNVWFVILWTRAIEPERATAPHPIVRSPLWVELGGGVLFAVGLYTFATALNDTLDVRRDRALHPDRPLPSGRVSIDAAVALVALTMILATLGAALMGMPAVLMALGTAAAVWTYNTAARFFPSAGLVLLALIYGAQMMTPNVWLTFVWPVWLAMTHMLLVGAATHLVARRRPALTPAMLISAGMGWAFWSAVLLYVGWQRAGTLWPHWVEPTAGIVPGVLTVAFIAFAVMRVRRAGATPRAAEKIQRYGALWLTLYATGWMMGQGEWFAAGVLGTLALAGFLGMTVLRELYNLVEHPVGYRR